MRYARNSRMLIIYQKRLERTDVGSNVVNGLYLGWPFDFSFFRRVVIRLGAARQNI